MAKKYGLDTKDGVLVTEVTPDSPFADILAEGMQIVEINNEPVSNISQARRLIVKGAINRLFVCFHGQTIYVGVRVPKE